MSESDCLFCKIAKGEIPCYKIYEDDHFLAFLDVYPLTEGHTLVIPKKHFRWVWDVQPAGEYFEVITKIANHLKTVLRIELVAGLVQGEGVAHAHFHLIPPGKGLDQAILASQQASYELKKEEALKLKERFIIK